MSRDGFVYVSLVGAWESQEQTGRHAVFLEHSRTRSIPDLKREANRQICQEAGLFASFFL